LSGNVDIYVTPKGKITPTTGHKGPEGEKRYSSTRWALDGVGVNAALLPHYPRERPSTHCVGGWVDLRAGLDWCGRTRPHRDSTSTTFENKDCVTIYNLLYHQRK